MICENCGKDNVKGAVFCSFCGEKITSDDFRRVNYRKNTAVGGQGRKQPIPDRPSQVVPRSVSTLIPRRRKREDMFFDDIDTPDEEPYSTERERDAASRRRSMIAGIVLLGVMIYIFWLVVLPGGQEYRARMGWGASAGAYASVAKGYLDDGDVANAAKFYYDALRLEPDNYEYTLYVAQTQKLLGDYNKALSAYAKCITINAEAVEPYMGVSEIYVAQGDNERAINALMTGFNRTGDLSLFRAYQKLNGNQSQL